MKIPAALLLYLLTFTLLGTAVGLTTQSCVRKKSDRSKLHPSRYGGYKKRQRLFSSVTKDIPLLPERRDSHPKPSKPKRKALHHSSTLSFIQRTGRITSTAKPGSVRDSMVQGAATAPDPNILF